MRQLKSLALPFAYLFTAVYLLTTPIEAAAISGPTHAVTLGAAPADSAAVSVSVEPDPDYAEYQPPYDVLASVAFTTGVAALFIGIPLVAVAAGATAVGFATAARLRFKRGAAKQRAKRGRGIAIVGAVLGVIAVVAAAVDGVRWRGWRF